MVLPALEQLNQIMQKPDTADRDRLNAIRAVLNRTGYNERHSVDIGLAPDNDWGRLEGTGVVQVSDDFDWDDGSQEFAGDSRLDPATPVDADDEGDDFARDFLRDREVHGTPGQRHDVVQGEVVDTSAPPDTVSTPGGGDPPYVRRMAADAERTERGASRYTPGRYDPRSGPVDARDRRDYRGRRR